MNIEFVHNWNSQVKKGTLSFIVLNILVSKEYYGYELIEKIKQLTDMDIAEGTLYPLMNRLKKEGLVTSRWVEQDTGIPRKYYMITREGKDTLNEMRKNWNKLEEALQKLHR